MGWQDGGSYIYGDYYNTETVVDGVTIAANSWHVHTIERDDEGNMLDIPGEISYRELWLEINFTMLLAIDPTKGRIVDPFGSASKSGSSSFTLISHLTSFLSSSLGDLQTIRSRFEGLLFLNLIRLP